MNYTPVWSFDVFDCRAAVATDHDTYWADINSIDIMHRGKESLSSMLIWPDYQSFSVLLTMDMKIVTIVTKFIKQRDKLPVTTWS